MRSRVVISAVVALLLACLSAAAGGDPPSGSPSPRIDLAPRDAVGRGESGSGAAEMLRTTVAPGAVKPRKSKVGVTVSCTDETGRVLKPGEADYDRCLSHSQMMDSRRPAVPGQPLGPNLNVNFGN